MTFAALRSLHSLIGDALEDIERIYQDASLDRPSSIPNTPYTVLTSPCTPYRRPHAGSEEGDDEDERHSFPVGQVPKTPNRAHRGAPSADFQMLDFPALDSPYYPTENHSPETDAAESLASHPDVIAATNRIVAACGQISATVHRPFLTMCDASMGYHLPACLRFLEATHTVEILRTAGPGGMHVHELSQHLNVDEGKLSHILRLLATHHITKEVRPNVFANNRISAIIDSGRKVEELQRSSENKYQATNGIAAFINLCTDELFKASAYLADCYLASRTKTTGEEHPMHAPFNVAFNTPLPYFEWLEKPGNEARLRRFGPAMTGTSAWEVPGAIVAAFPWQDMREGALIVDVGGGIGSTSMLLAHTFPNLRFVIQDRPQVIEQGAKAWRERCPDMLDTGRAMFFAHDFFHPQPPLLLPGTNHPTRPSVYILRVITHDWPDAFVIKILLNLRIAASPDTKLLLADHILPLACVDEDIDPLPGVVSSLAPEGSPLLPNLGKANANAYWMDLTMRVTFNAQERTLREMSALTLAAGWKIVDVAHAEGSLFGHMTAVPVEIPTESLSLLDVPPPATNSDAVMRARSGSVTSATGTVRMDHTFGTLSSLPTDEAIRKPARKDRRSFLPWWRGRKDSQSSKAAKPLLAESPVVIPRAQKTRPRLAIVTSPTLETTSFTTPRSPNPRTSSMVRLSAPDSDATAVSSPETTPDSAKRRHERLLQSAALAAPAEPLLLPALEPAPPMTPRLRSAASRTSLRKKASQVFELGKASVASLRSAALGVTSPHAHAPPVPPLPPLPTSPVPRSNGVSTELARDTEASEESASSLGGGGSGSGGALKSLKKMRSRSQLGLARVHVEVRSGKAEQKGGENHRVESFDTGEDTDS
ncbi:S-adenosyl-L-methionine-dependent methyltransferase [Cubamyces lactineus]|nr:S-adenosyl-L-methionine-dependent methyltransferase [Cubamyces lactineus]